MSKQEILNSDGYSFFPESNIVFETQCLKDIASFLDKLMLERKIEKQSA